MIKVKRIHDAPSHDDGFRILVDRLWPRGIKKGRAHVDLWLHQVAPSHDLREWFSHDPRKWGTFKARYEKELRGKKDWLDQVRDAERERDTVTLLFAARDRQRNNAVALKQFLGKSVTRRTMPCLCPDAGDHS